ncbi:GntR family transcriptional regulator [Salipiger abyssi]|uniref:GntR family transcriptional regulator n=1 Tax=Salipiger abyssi TaxID=1250539 RepID=UPI001A8E854A|nr:GntR family transcriptional regulator [Salipiger abyssi]MBN9885875.1 GntR family transcriptional regulator [Salipiger abyssi]
MDAKKKAEKLDAASFIRDAITRGDYQPNERLIENDLSKRIGVNRSLIRVALARLEQEGLVVIEPNRGARVRLISDREAIEIVETRCALELLIVRYAAERATEEDKEELRRIVGEMEALFLSDDLIRYSRTNGLFHRKLHEIAQHETATKMLGMLRSQMVRFQYRAILVPDRARKSLAEHKAVFAAVEANSPDRAEHAMRRHLKGVIDGIRDAIAASQAMADV